LERIQVSEHVLQASITVFHGDNRLEISERLSSVRNAIDPTGLSTSVFEQASTSVPDIAVAVGSPGFFGAERLVICFNLISPTSGSRNRRSAKSEASNDEPLPILQGIAPGVRLVVVEDSLTQADERRIRKQATDIHIVNVRVPRGRALVDWTCERARRHGATIDGASATSLIEALDRFNRSYEYDSLGDSYARFLLEVVLPEVETKTSSDGRPIRLSTFGSAGSSP
jgi:DNA polymerase III delta subunit